MRKHKERPPFVMLEKDLMWKERKFVKENPSRWPWWELSPGARAIYQMLKAQYNGPTKGTHKTNNGKLALHRREILDMKINGLRNPNTIMIAFRELIKKGWIKEEEKIGGKHRWTILYRLTWKYDNLQ